MELIAPKIGCVPQTLLEWVKRGEVDADVRTGVTTFEAQCIKELEREVKELRRANEILKLASTFFRSGGARRPFEEVKRFIDQHRHLFYVEPICEVLQIAPSCYRRHSARQRHPELRCARAQRDDELMAPIQRVWHTNMQV